MLLGIAAPFLAIFLHNRSRKWALIVGSLLAIIGILPLSTYLPDDDFEGRLVILLFVYALPVIFFTSQKNWWALIPAGFFASVGLVALLAILIPVNTYFHAGKFGFSIYTGVLFLGIAITFSVLRLLRASRPTAWAIYLAGGSLIIAILVSLFSRGFVDMLPALVSIIVGGSMIVTALFK